jgi:hypothetical protein
MKRKSRQRWSTIPPISTKQTIICHLISLNTKRGNTRYFNILQSKHCRGGSRGRGAHPARAPRKIGKNIIFLD